MRHETYLLDTNVCAFLLRGKFGIDEMIRKVGIENCHISEITYAELLFGVERSANKEKNRQLLSLLAESINIVPIGSVLNHYAIEKSKLWSIGKPVDDFDLLIGVTSVYYKFTMVTDNTRHFQNIDQIKLENWIARG